MTDESGGPQTSTRSGEAREAGEDPQVPAAPPTPSTPEEGPDPRQVRRPDGGGAG